MGRDLNDILREDGDGALNALLNGASPKKAPKAKTPEEIERAIRNIDRRMKGWDEARSQASPTPNAVAAPNKFKLIRYKDIQPVFEEEWITDGLLPGSGLVAIYGPPGCGKSFFALHWVLHAAAGKTYAGRATKKVRVVYIAAEGQAGFRKRVMAASKEINLDKDIQFDLIEVAPNLGTNGDDLKLLIEAIKDGTEDGDEPVKIIVIDTLSRSLGGADENGPGMAKFIENAGELSREFNCVVVCVHHTGKNAALGMRGWSGLHGATDAEFEVVDKNGTRYVRITKMKDGEDGLGWTFALAQVEAGNTQSGKRLITCIVELLSDPATTDRSAESGAQGRPKRDLPRSLRVFDEALNEALIVHGKSIWLEGAGAKTTSVRAVDVEHVKREFGKRWIVGKEDAEEEAPAGSSTETQAKQRKRKREQAVWATFKRTLHDLPRQYRTEEKDGIEYIWKLECKTQPQS
jgi:KaiC/GvpD/RAD55 family RecA-like ATPase